MIYYAIVRYFYAEEKLFTAAVAAKARVVDSEMDKKRGKEKVGECCRDNGALSRKCGGVR